MSSPGSSHLQHSLWNQVWSVILGSQFSAIRESSRNPYRCFIGECTKPAGFGGDNDHNLVMLDSRQKTGVKEQVGHQKSTDLPYQKAEHIKATATTQVLQ